MNTAAEMRRAFDRAFAELPAEGVARFEDLLAIGVGPSPFAMRLREVAGLFADKSITALPSPVAELLGVAGFRGALVPVYDLRALLGFPVNEPPRWLVLVTGSSPIALAFDRFEGHLRVSPDAIAAQAANERQGHAHEVVRSAGVARPIVHVASVIEAIKISQRER